MKNTIVLISIALFSFYFHRCSIKESNTTELQKLPFESIKSAVPEKLFDLTSVDVIPIETSKDFLISDQIKLKIVDNNIFILDFKSEKMYRFDREGHFLNQIGYQGKGPKEYLRPKDFIVDTKNRQVEILDSPKTKVKIYSYNGDFISDFKFDFSAISFIKDRSDNYFFYCGINDYSEDEYRVKYTDSNKIHSELFKNTGKPGIGYFSFDVDIFSDNGDGIIFKENFFPSIYFLVKDSARKIIEFDFGKHTFYPEDLIEINSTVKFLKTLTNKGFYGLKSLLTSKNKFIFNIIFQDNSSIKIYYLFYDSVSKEIKKVSFNEKDSLFWAGRLRDYKDDKFIFTIDAMNTKTVGNQIPSAQSKLKNITDDDNPVILIFKNKLTQ